MVQFQFQYWVLLFGPIAAIGIITPIYIFGALAILPKAIKSVNWSEVLPVSIAGSIAVFVGLSILVNTNPLVIKNIMGFFILLTTLIMIAGRKYNGPRNIFTSIITGLLTGGIRGDRHPRGTHNGNLLSCRKNCAHNSKSKYINNWVYL